MSSVHVTPLLDVIAHDETDDCPCGPRTEPVTRDDGSVGWLVIHHSLDNRETTGHSVTVIGEPQEDAK